MVYPQCLLNFIELLYSWGAAHGNIVQTVLDIFEGLKCSMFQNHPLTSLHKRILPWKDTLTQDSIGGFSFYMFCLENLKARRELRRRVDLTEGSCHFSFCGMRMNLMTC